MFALDRFAPVPVSVLEESRMPETRRVPPVVAVVEDDGGTEDLTPLPNEPEPVWSLERSEELAVFAAAGGSGRGRAAPSEVIRFAGEESRA